MSTRDTQRAFVGLLGRPLVTPASDGDLHRSVTRNFKGVADTARRLGYRISNVGRVHRLVRVPVAGTVTAPPAPLDAPSRRVLALTCVLAAACEDSSGGVTLSRLSDQVAQLTAAPGSPVTAYDPIHMSHRRQLLRASRELEHWGVLRRRTRDDRLLDDWADDGSGIGAGYDIDRDALLLLTSPDVLALALDDAAPDPEQVAATRTLRALRAMVETPAVLYAEMDPADAEVLRTTRGLRSSDVAAFTGGHVEARAEGLVLIQPDDPVCPVTVGWPRAATASWVALIMADLAGRAGTRQSDGTVVLTDAEVDDCATALHQWRAAYLNKKLREDASQIRPEAETVLRHLALLRTPPAGGWVLSPVAARYRDPDIVLGGSGTSADNEITAGDGAAMAPSEVDGTADEDLDPQESTP